MTDSRRPSFRVSKSSMARTTPGVIDDLETHPFDDAGERDATFANAVKTHSDLREPEAYAGEIRRLWSDASRKFLAIGAYLLQAKRSFVHGEKMKSLEAMLPFGYPTAHRLMRIAEAVEDRRLSKDDLPANYATAYLLTTFNPTQLEEAKRRDLVRTDVTRKLLEDFKAEGETRGRHTRMVLLDRERRSVVSRLERLNSSGAGAAGAHRCGVRHQRAQRNLVPQQHLSGL